jgi:hypothetical protein
MRSLQTEMPRGTVKFNSGELVRVTRQELKYDRATCRTEIFRALKVVDRTHQAVCELPHVRDRQIEDSIYNCELVNFEVLLERVKNSHRRS